MDKKYIYVIEDLDSGRIKIGRSKDPSSRLKQIQTGNPNTLKLGMVKERAYSSKFESWLHREFSANRLNGEWFSGITSADVSRRLMGCLLWDWDVD